MFPYLLLSLIVIGYVVSIWKLFEKANRTPWHAFVPFLSTVIWLRMIGRPLWWGLFLLIPGVNVLMFWVLNYELARAFGKRTTMDVTLAVLFPFVFFPRLAFDPKICYKGAENGKNTPQAWYIGWRDALVYATIAATTLNLFTFQAYTIPSPSMEGSLLTGDRLLVSKLHYGPRLPNTPISVPFTHNRVPGSMVPSYLEWFSLPYMRLPGPGKINRNDPVVFNFPANDTFITEEELSSHTYHQFLTNMAWEMSNKAPDFESRKAPYLNRARKKLEREYGLGYRPVDKRENYVKRCVGLPGDTLRIVNRQLYINTHPVENPENLQFNYTFRLNRPFHLSGLCKQFGLREEDIRRVPPFDHWNVTLPLSPEKAKQIGQFSNVTEVSVQNHPPGYDYGKDETYPQYCPIFPNAPTFDWSVDNFGPLIIPEKGKTVRLTPTNLPLYRRIIHVYEAHDLKVINGQIFIDGKVASHYTFEMDYYWMMGDNRHHSADSRYWGFVPEDHIVGKPVLVWFSKEKGRKIRWDRVFSWAK